MTQMNLEADQNAVIVDDAGTHSTLASTLTAGLQRATLSRITPKAPQADMPEQKRSIQMTELDDNLSEFERARRTSKTWSMGQD